MASPDALLPVDTSVPLPPSVVKNAALAADLHKAAYGGAEPPAEPPKPDATPPAEPPKPDATPPAEPPKPEPPVTPPPPPSRPEDRSGVDPASFEGRYYAMEGRYRQSQATIGSLQEQLSELGDELVRWQERNRQSPQPTPDNSVRLITDDDVKTYGPELIDLIQRTAKQTVAPDLSAITDQTRKVSQQVSKQAGQNVYEYLDEHVPTWRDVNVSDRFKAWCRLPDVYSGVLRGQLLKNAFQAADAPRVARFFKGFLDEEVATGNASSPRSEPGTQDPPRKAALDLETLTAPGRAKPATGDTPASSADKPILTRAQIAQFYSNVRRGAYAGRDADKAKDEAMIFAAQREGRVR